MRDVIAAGFKDTGGSRDTPESVTFPTFFGYHRWEVWVVESNSHL